MPANELNNENTTETLASGIPLRAFDSVEHINLKITNDYLLQRGDKIKNESKVENNVDNLSNNNLTVDNSTTPNSSANDLSEDENSEGSCCCLPCCSPCSPCLPCCPCSRSEPGKRYKILDCCSAISRGANHFFSNIGHYLRLLFTYVYVLLMIYAIPFLIFWFLVDTEYIPIPYWISVGSILLTNVGILIEMIFSFYNKWITSSYWVRKSDELVYPKRVLAMFAAYLPNEINTLEAPIRAMVSMNVPNGVKLTVVVAHNGGSQKNLNKLGLMIKKIEVPENVELHFVEIALSRSKADNINAILDWLKYKDYEVLPEYIGIFDADHRPHVENLERGLKTLLLSGADIVQGRNCIALGSRFIAVEFDVIYTIYHPGGARLRGFGIFGGSNGWWRRKVLDKVRMRNNMLTEDIDSTMRALRLGAKVIYNRHQVSYEEAPPGFCALIKQRLRWTQGWSEVAVKHSLGLIFGRGFGCCCCKPERFDDELLDNEHESEFNEHESEFNNLNDLNDLNDLNETDDGLGTGLNDALNGEFDSENYQRNKSENKRRSHNCCVGCFRSFRKRVGITFFLLWREIYPYLASIALPAGVAALVKCTRGDCVEEGIIVMTCLLAIFPLLNTLVVYFVTGKNKHPKMKWYNYIVYLILSIPYEMFKFHLSVFGHARNIVGLTKWQVTKRGNYGRYQLPDEITDIRREEITYGYQHNTGEKWCYKPQSKAGMINEIIIEAQENRAHQFPITVDNEIGDNNVNNVGNNVDNVVESGPNNNDDTSLSNSLNGNNDNNGNNGNNGDELEIIRLR